MRGGPSIWTDIGLLQVGWYALIHADLHSESISLTWPPLFGSNFGVEYAHLQLSKSDTWRCYINWKGLESLRRSLEPDGEKGTQVDFLPWIAEKDNHIANSIRFSFTSHRISVGNGGPPP